jgi:chorismate synthase
VRKARVTLDQTLDFLRIMSGSTLGRLFTVTNFGESHGPAIGCVIDGCPPGMALTEADIQFDLDRRKPGTSRHVTQRREDDRVEILSGVFEGKTTGTPIALLIRNEDQRSKDYGNIADSFRPGHADYTYWQKYGIRDYRGGGRSSARLTAPTVAAGAVAKKWLNEKFGVHVRGYLAQLGENVIPFQSWDHVAENAFFAPNRDLVPALENYMDQLRKSGESCGARVNVVASGVPVGWGDPIYDRLDASIAFAMMGLNAVKGVEIGAGFASVTQRGTEHSDEMTPEGFRSNNAGGVLGGISTGQDVTVSVAIKPTSSIRLDRHTIDKSGQPVVINTHGRHDPCVGIRATPIVEALLALVLIDHALIHRAQNGDVVTTTPHVPGKGNHISTSPRPELRQDPDPAEA